MKERLYRIGSAQLSAARLESIIAAREYLVTYRTVYQVEKTARGYKGTAVFRSHEYVPIIRRGYFTTMTAERLKRMFPGFPANN